MRFGTGGIRQIMGPAPTQINPDTIWRWSCALGAYLQQTHHAPQLDDHSPIRVLISYDARHHSREYAVLAALALQTYQIVGELLDKISPTPLISYAVAEFGYQAGVMITASHNPKEYNGYKIYGSNGGQIVSPQDAEIEQWYQKLATKTAPNSVDESGILMANTEALESAYVRSIVTSIRPRKGLTMRSMAVVYSALHGSGYELVPKTLQKADQMELYCVEDQCIPDGNFPTILLPNPEEKSSFTKAIELAKKQKVPLIMLTDGDGDRLGVAVQKRLHGPVEYQILDGNQQAALLLDWYLRTVGEDQLGKDPFVIKTIPTTSLFTQIANKWNVACETVPTGFKNISAKITELREKGKSFCLAAEESCGFLLGTHCLDKDGILAAWAFAHMELTSMEQYLQLTQRYRYMVFDKVIGIPLLGDPIIVIRKIEDYLLAHPQVTVVSNQEMDFPVDFGKIYVRMRASGTEAKIKFYFTRRAIVCTTMEEFEQREEEAHQVFTQIVKAAQNNTSGAGI